MNNTVSKKAFILLNTSFIIIFIIVLIATYTRYSTTVISVEFHKDLVKIRGYWATYGAKELENDMTYTYYDSNLRNKIYDIEVTKTTLAFCPICNNTYKWEILSTSNTSINDNLIFKRLLTVKRNDNNVTISYK